MHTLLVLTSTYPRWKGDVEPSFVHLLCRQLSSSFRIIVLAPHYPGAALQEELDGILVYRFRYFPSSAEKLAYNGGINANLKNCRLKYLLVPFFALGQLLAIGALCRKYRFCLIHAHWVIPQGLIALFARRLYCPKVKVLCTSHGGDLFGLQGGVLESLKRYVYRHCDQVTVVSSTMKRRLEHMGCPTDIVSIHSMGVNLRDQFVPADGNRKEADLIFVGRLVEKKGVGTLIEAVHLLRTDFPTLRLKIVGNGPERHALEHRVAELQLDKQVEFLGSRPNDDMPAHYRSAPIAVVPSVVAADGDQEGLGLVAVEALGCGCAVIASDVPALQDVVQDGKTGLVFHSNDARDLSMKIRKLITDDSMRELLARQGREAVLMRFDWQEVGMRYQHLIGQCISG
jgi:glycosyltransferase involved in cell wall biosynthesis